MSFLPIIKPDKPARIVEKRGFIKVRQSGSHAVFSQGKGLLRKILRDVEITPEEIKKR